MTHMVTAAYDLDPGVEAHKPMTMTAFDLDRTLIYSMAALDEGTVTGPLTVVEYLNGSPLSRMTKKSWHMLRLLMETAEVVPVTTRTQKQYERVSLPYTPRYALCANGGVLLVDGERDPDWDTWIKSVVAMSAPVTDIQAILDAFADAPWVKSVKTAEGLFCYLVAHSRRQIPAKWLREFVKAANRLRWVVSVQGRKVYAVPEGMSKATSLVRLRNILDQHHPGEVRLYSAGDSLLDAPMMEASDEAIRPAHGELHTEGWTAAGVAVTNGTGAAAGEEIVGWMLDQAKNP